MHKVDEEIFRKLKNSTKSGHTKGKIFPHDIDMYLKMSHLCFLLAANLTRFPYPTVNRDESFEEEHHGVKIKDPYHWLEDLESPETQDFVNIQNKLTDEFLDSVPQRTNIRKAYAKSTDHFVNSIPVQSGNRYYFKEHTGIYMRETLTSDPEILFDPLTPNESLGDFTFSENGEILAYSLSKYGSDWKTVHFKGVMTRQNYPDVLNNTKWPDMAWTPDNLGIFYNSYPMIRNQVISCHNKVYYHRLNTMQQEDILIAEFPAQPNWSLSVEVSHCGKYLLVSVFDNFNANAVYIASLVGTPIRKGFQKNLVPLFPSVVDAEYSYISNIDTTFYFMTNKNANNGRLISINVTTVLKPNSEDVKEGIKYDFVITEVIPQRKDKVLEWAHLIKQEYLVVCYLQDVKTTLEMFNITNEKRQTIFPLKTVKITQSSVSNHNSTEFFFRTESFVNPGTVYRCDANTGKFICSVYTQDEIQGLDLENVTVKQVYFRSKDKTTVPMFIVHHKNLVQDGTSPAILTGYGGFKFNSLADFSFRKLFFIQNFGGVFAVANIRGGGEFGKKWHEDGSRFKKQNTFDDFIAAAEYLIARKYTNKSNLAIEGSSNGGLLVAACINQRPELFGAAVIEVGVLDMLRFQKFTGGYVWCADYGCSEDKEDFENLIKFSPLHNIAIPKNNSWEYPAVLVITAENDDRVVPSHSYKYIAQLQHIIGNHNSQTKPLLLRVNINAGHDGKTAEDEMDTLVFLMESMSLDYDKHPQQLRNLGNVHKDHLIVLKLIFTTLLHIVFMNLAINI
ncbi:unnamed protein product [Allacma fusca]|uniref:Prolyl endopeptidase n=1 Tax=Allacma fusca TaxID=39272 RepID=A0A8J2JVY6_9HEXA|nr:unnamed protein product [Allacma fusca]